ncbi:MAG: amidohydrolase family protein, partial [Limisphaerales bacterium]
IKTSTNPRGGIGLSPHALYSTTPELLKLAAQESRKKNWRLTTHVAESEEEFEMFIHRRGRLFDWLKTQRDMSDCGNGSPIQQLEKLEMLSGNFLAIHVNYLTKGDAEILSKKKVSVVHCPRSHSYFRHQDFPYNELNQAGVNICLGTDSLASVSKIRAQPMELNMFAEMKSFSATHSGLLPATILQMATQNGARALGLSGKIGELAENSFADLIAISFQGKITDAYEAIVKYPGDIFASMIHGEWAIPPK